jgi:sulfur carrier protein
MLEYTMRETKSKPPPKQKGQWHRYCPMVSETITLNGASLPLTSPMVLSDLLLAQGLDPTQPGFAVALNRQLVRRADWPTTHVQPGDVLDVVHARQGG